MNINTGYVDNASAIRDEKRRSPLDRDVSGDDINGNQTESVHDEHNCTMSCVTESHVVVSYPITVSGYQPPFTYFYTIIVNRHLVAGFLQISSASCGEYYFGYLHLTSSCIPQTIDIMPSNVFVVTSLHAFKMEFDT